MPENSLEDERAIMIMMRKTLSGIIRDVTPLPGMQGILKDETVVSIRRCLGVIAAREQKIARLQNREVNERPRYADEPQKSHIIKFKRSDDDRP